MRSCIYRLKWNRTKGKHKNVQKGGKKPLLCTFRSTHSSNIILGLSGMNSCLSLLSITLSHGNRVTGHLTVGITRPEYTENTKHVLYHYPGHYSLLTGKKNPLASFANKANAFCQHSVTSQWHVKYLWQLTRHLLSEWRQRYSMSDQRSQSVLFQAANKGKGEGNYSQYKSNKSHSSHQNKDNLRCQLKNKTRRRSFCSTIPTILNICSSFQKSFNSSFSDRTRLFVLWRVCLSPFVCLLQKNVHAW